MFKILLLFEGSIRATRTYNFLKEIDTSYIFFNIVTAGMGTFRFRLSDYIFPYETIIQGYKSDNEYIIFEINKTHIKVTNILIDGIFQAEITKIYLSNI